MIGIIIAGIILNVIVIVVLIVRQAIKNLPYFTV